MTPLSYPPIPLAQSAARASRKFAFSAALAALFLAYPLLLSATPPYQWQRSFGANTNEICAGGFATADGGMVLYGGSYRNERTYSDIYIVKLDRRLNFESEHIIEGEQNNTAICMAQAPDGGYVLCGTAVQMYDDGYHTHRAYLAKLDEDFEVVWERLYGYHGIQGVQLSDMELLPDGSIVAVGMSNDKGWMIVCDDEGRANVSAVFDGIDAFTTIEPADRGGVVVMDDNGVYHRYDLEANELWQTPSWVGQSIRYDASDMVRTSDGCYFRMSTRFDHVDSLKVSKVNADGEYVYQRTTAVEDRPPTGRIVALADGGVVTVDGSLSFCRLNSNGEVLVDRWVNYSDMDPAMGYLSTSKIFRIGNGLAIAGTAQPGNDGNREAGGSDFVHVALNLAGDVSSHQRYGLPGGSVEIGCGVVALADGNIGAVVSSGANEDIIFRPKLFVISQEGDSLETIDLPYDGSNIMSFGLVPSPHNWLMASPGWILSGVYEERWTPYQWISLLDRNFQTRWTRTVVYNREPELLRPPDLLVERNGDVLLISSAEGASSLKRVDYMGVLRDSLVTEPGPFYAVAQPTDTSYAVLTSNCEVLTLDRRLQITGWFDAGIPNYENNPSTMISNMEGELIVLSRATSPAQGDSVYICKINTRGQVLWRTRNGSSGYYNGIDRLIDAGDGRFFLLGNTIVQQFDRDGNYKGGRALPEIDLDYHFPSIYYSLAADGGLYSCCTFGEDALVGRIPYDSLGIRERLPLRIDQPEIQPTPDTPYLSVSPNPFNSMATLRYRLAASSNIEIALFDISGRSVRSLASGFKNAGEQSFTLDASGLSGGIYLVRLQTAAGICHQKVVIQR